MPVKVERTSLTKLTPLKDRVVVADMKFTERFSAAGILIPSDDMKVQGVRPRWGKVYAVGPDQKDIQVGQWVLVEHGRWTRGIDITDPTGDHTIRMVDNKDIIAVSDEEVLDETFGRPL